MPTDPYGRTSPPWSSMFPGQSRRIPPDQLRVSDAERQEIADALGKHFADGRLDRAELDDRVHRAMSAKTRSDFAGLLDDLPHAGPPAGSAVAPSRRHRPRLSFLAIVAIVALIVGASISAPWWHIPWFLIFVVAFFLLRGPRRWRYHHHHHPYGPPPPPPPPYGPGPYGPPPYGPGPYGPGPYQP